jgi:hypothetical protein
MTPFFALLAVAPASATATLDASGRAHAALRRFHAIATVQGGGQGKSSLVNYDILADGDDVRMRVVELNPSKRGRSDKTFFFQKTKVTAYDAVANERLSRPVPSGTTRLGRTIFTLGPVDDPVRFLLDGKQMAEFYGNFRTLKNWKVTTNAKGTTLVRVIKMGAIGTNSTTLRFAPKTNLLTYLSIKDPKGFSKWTIRYTTPSKPRLNIPRSAKTVDSFTVAPEPPKFRTSAAQTLAERTLGAYRNLRRGVISVRDDGGLTTITIDGKRVREQNPAITYAYDGKTLTILDPRNRVIYRGIAAASRVPAYIAAIKGRVDPLSRQVLQDRVPMQELMVPDMVVATGGAVEMDGVMCDILKFDNPRTRVMLCVRRDIRLLDSATTNTIDRNGMPIVTTARRFRYQRLGKPQPANLFTIGNKPGYAVKKLPALGKS